ncbi:MAG: DUF86 domain-containing protein [Longimicrobiales bacterium]
MAELDAVLAELRSMDDNHDADQLSDDLARRWSLERGLLAAANLIFDVANHIGAGHFSVHPATYEDGLRLLAARQVIAEETYYGLRGLGGFRNVLAHEYLDIDLEQVILWKVRILDAVPPLIGQVQAWLDDVQPGEA